jgi:hypothetical protein
MNNIVDSIYFQEDPIGETLDVILAETGKTKNLDITGEIELALMRTKWFDYRSMCSTLATYLFAEEFKKAYRNSFASNIDSRRAPYIPVFLKPKEPGRTRAKAAIDPFDSDKAIVTGLWRCRRVADALGVPYDIYLSLAMKRRLSYWQQRNLPKIYHLYDKMVTDYVVEKWEEHQKTKLYFSTQPEYKNDCYCDLPAQNDHHEWLFAQLKLRLNNPHTLARLIYEDKVLPAKKARSRLGDEICDKAAQLAESIPH